MKKFSRVTSICLFIAMLLGTFAIGLVRQPVIAMDAMNAFEKMKDEPIQQVGPHELDRYLHEEMTRMPANSADVVMFKEELVDDPEDNVENSITEEGLIDDLEDNIEHSITEAELVGDPEDNIEHSITRIEGRELNIVKGSQHFVIIKGKDISEFADRAVDLTYDLEKLELVDVAAQVYGTQAAVGEIPGTGITIIATSPGSISLTMGKDIPQGKSWSGVITILEFKALATGTTNVTVE